MKGTKSRSKRLLTLLLAVIMIITSLPLDVLAKVNYEKLTDDKEKFVNTLTPVKPAKLAGNEKAEEFIKNPDQPAIYTLRTDYKVQRGEKYYIDYQPYIASVGAGATQAEKDKVNKPIDLPDLAGYKKPQENFTIDYKTIFDAANGKNETGNATNGLRYFDKQDFKYTAKTNGIKVKHVFQDLEDFTKYTNPDGSTDEKHARYNTQKGNTGSTLEVRPLEDNEIKGFIPEAEYINMQVPENAENFILEYRYNRKHYDVVFDTAGGTALPSRTLYYEQVIPKIADESIPTKVGGDFLGWKPSVELKTKDGKTYKANEIIAVGTGAAIKNLDNDLLMPASKLTFTAVWKDKEKADYAVQFWAEKADHADNASLLDKYDYIGTRVYKQKATGSRPDLDKEPVKDIVFPDLDQARLNDIWAGKRFNQGRNLYLNKFYVYNQALTHEQNKDPENVNLVKSVDATGRTVYNIYYDRQVYDLYFTKSNIENSFYPEIWGLDENNKQVQLGGPGNPYHYKARFNQLMTGWPNDAMQTKGFSEGMQSFGWGPNYVEPYWPLHLDTPPYRLNADEFLDMGWYTDKGGYVTSIDDGAGGTIPAKDFTTLSFGIKQDKGSMPHHMDFWMDGFKPGEQIVRYDLYRSKADTKSPTYQHKYSQVQGFTPKRDYEFMDPFTEDDVDGINAKRAKVTPFPAKTYTDMYGAVRPIGKMPFIYAFFNNADEWGDALVGDSFDENGYIKFEYYRNKYPLRFNYDPSKIKGDNEFGPTNQLDTFYEFPLKALSPKVDTGNEYKKDNPANLLDNPKNLQTLGLTDLVFTDTDGKLKVKRPDKLSDQMVFKGWALDPAGTKLIWENPGEKMPSHPVNLYAKWGEPDYQWKVTFDPDGGKLSSIDETKVTQKRKTIQVGDIGQEERKTFAKKEKNDGDKQVFTVIQRQKLVEPPKPTKKGYDFMGWEVIRYKRDASTGDYTTEQDTSYRETYKVPELYSFGNDVVSPIYLKAIWVPNDRVDVDVVHHILSLDLKEETKKITETLHSKRAGYLVATTGYQQNDELTLADHKELEEKLTGDLKTLYEEYNKRVKANNTFFQTFRVEPAKKLNPTTNQVEDNPDVKNNVFHFFYRPFRTRDYKVNYIDERFKDDPAKGIIIDQEEVSNGNRHYDARNYRPIPGWKLVSDPQQQLFFDVNEDTNAFLGINGTGKDEITFYYKDVRVIEVPKDGKTPEGYVRVTFKADKGGSFGKDEQGKPITELNYDVIKGLQSQLLPVPKELADGETVDKDKHYITPETGRKFIKWDKSPLLNDNTIINEAHTFTAFFEWSGLTASGLVRTEAFKDPNGKWTNDFAPTIDQLKAQLVWKEKDQVKDLPAGTEIKLYDETGNELTSDDQIYNLVNEKKAADKDELVRTVNIKAKVTFKDGKEAQELTIPITVYKNVYEALNKAGDKPLFLKEAEGKEAKDGGLSDVTGDYVMVTIKPTRDMDSKDDKIYWVNTNAWVEIPEVKPDGSSTFVNWTADKDAQNENGVFDFTKRHKFTEDTIISPSDAKDVVEQTDPNKKPDVPNSYVKVIVKTTDKATDDTAFEKTYWVNPTKEVTIGVTNPTGKTVAADPAKVGAVGYTWDFSKWETEDKAKAWEETIVGKFEKETTILAKYSIKFETIKDQIVKNDTVHTPQGKTPTVDEIKAKITPPDGKTIKEVKIVENPDVNNPGKSIAKVIVEYTDGSSVGTNEKPLEVPVEVHKNIIPEAPGGQRPKDALDNYVKVILKAGEGGKFENTLTNQFVYYVSPEVEVDMTDEADKISKTPDTGYIVNGGEWKNKDNKALKGTFTDAETIFEYNFKKSTDIVEKTDDSVKKPEGYVEVIFKADAKGKLEGDVTEKTYFVNPKAGIKLVNKDKATPGAKNELVVPETIADENYKFDKWYEEIDTVNSITSERIHVAKFKLNKVTLTYEAGEGATGTVPKSVTVDHGTKVEIAAPVNLKKDYSSFKGWLIGTKTYQPGEEITLTENTTAKAQWVSAEDIIPYDPSAKDPTPRPDGYVRVSFAADEGLKLTEQKAYYVKKNAGIKLGNTELVKPGYTAETGYKFTNWDREDSLVIADQDVLVTAKATVLPDFDTTTHPGYVKVTFVAGANGVIKENGNKIDEKVYYVNPTKYVNLPAPTPEGNTGYDFGAWKSDKITGDFSLANFVNYKEDTTITAMFNQKEAVYPKLKADESDKPAGYVKVTFVINGTDGKIAENEVTTYYVDPSREVSLKTPTTIAGTGFMFDGWRFEDNTTAQKINPADKKIYKNDTTIYGSFKKLDDIIPARNDDGTQNLQPNDYVQVLFIKGEHAQSMDGQALYYVNPKAGKTIADVPKPTIVPDTGWEKDGWDKDDNVAIDKSIYVTAKYKPIADAIEKIDANTKKPDGYVTVTFKSGQHGKIQENGADITEKVYYVNPAKYVHLTPPDTVPDTSYEFSTWSSDNKDFILANSINFTKDTTLTAMFNAKDDVIPKTKNDESEKPAGFVTVNFVIEGQGGQIETGEIITYFVDPSKAVTIQPPKTKAEIGYEFENWNPDTTTPKQYNTETTVKGSFKKLEDIIKAREANGTINAKPEGYVLVQYLKGEHGVLDGQTTFYVNPKAGKKLEDLDISGITIVPNPTYKFANWDKPMNTPIIGPNDIDVTALYTQLPNIIKAGATDTAPLGYVVVIFETDGRGTITGNIEYEKDKTNPAKNETEIVYFVNPKNGVKLAAADATASQTVLPVPTTTPNDATKYIFDQWRADIDTTTPITRGRVHIAMFKPKEVKLTYDANGATEGSVPAELTVDYDTNVRLAGKGNLAKKDAKFLGWKIGDKIYQAGDQINLKENKTAYAQWDDDKKIIEYDPVHNPTTRPDDTYVRVTFAADDGLKLTEQKAYYVKKDAGITLETIKSDAKYGYPNLEASTGYKFEKWDKEDRLEITTDITVTAKATKLGTVIPEKDTNGNLNTKPEGYKEVKFVVKTDDSSKGSLEGNTKFYVNPTEYVTINPPTTKANTGFEFGAWDKDATIPTVYGEDTTITGSFNELKAVIPKTNPDGTENTKPAGYKTVTFEIDPATGGSIVTDEITVYYVNPEKEVAVPQPKTLAETGYEFEKWDQDTATAKMYIEDTTVKGNFKKLDDIVDGNKPKPDGYITVTFDKGEHGKEITGQTVYYVNPKADPVKTLGDELIAKPKVTAETGYKFTGWDKDDATPITGPADILVKAKYDPIDDVVPKDNPQGGENEKPAGYITVTFKTTDKAGSVEKVVYINPSKAVKLEDQAPNVTPITGYEFADWDRPIKEKIQYEDKDVITAQFNEIGNVSKVEKPGYVKVEFKQGDHGTLTGDVNLWIKPGVEVTIPAPTVNPSVGYKFNKWDKDLTVNLNASAPTYEITAEYSPLEDIIPQEKTDGSDKPFGYKTVTFVADANGSLSGKTVYYVNPKEVDLTNTADAITKNPNTGYTAEGGTWDKTLKATFNDGEVITFNFKALDDVIEEKPGVTIPEGYVTVKFIPTDKATDETKAEKVYFVNPLKEVTITETPVGTKVKDANDVSYDYTFTGWTVTRGAINSWTGPKVNDTFIQDTEITAKYSMKIGNIMPLPLAKDNTVTAINDVPEAKDLIKNPGDLPQGTEFAYAPDGEPKVDEAGNVTAKVKVTYPNGKTSIVTVPITVVDNVVPQIGNDKPLVPDSYIKVTVDPTDAATDNTNNKKIFWVKPNTQVTLDGIYDPIGKDIVEGNVTKPNKFTKWTLKDSDPVVEYTLDNNSITASFAKESTIIANYENVENIPPVGNDHRWFPLNSKPEPKEFIKNIYDDNDPNNMNNLPPGTKFAFKPGTEPVTGQPGSPTTTILVTYPNGEVKEIAVPYKVTGDVVEQEHGSEKPTVPDYFVRVIVNTTDLATDESKFEKTYWVDPDKNVTIPVTNPSGKKVDKTQTSPEIQYVFKGWKSEEAQPRTWAESISGQFTAKLTTITAQYDENIAQPGKVETGMVYTSESLKRPDGNFINNYLPTEEELETLIKAKDPEIELVEFVTTSFEDEIYDKLQEKPGDINISRKETITAKLTFKNGSKSEIEIPIVVYKNIYEGLTNGGKPDYVARAERDLNTPYVRVTLIPTAKAKNQQRKTYYVRKNASVIIPEIKAEGRDAYRFLFWEAEKPGLGQENPNYEWANMPMRMYGSAAPFNVAQQKPVEDKEIVDFGQRMSFDRDTDIVAQYETIQEPSKPDPWTPGYIGGGNIYIGKPSEKPTEKAKEPVAEHEYRKEVRYMQGFNGYFRPNDGLTRAEAAQILANALVEDGYKYTENFKLPYKDVKEEWYTRAIRIVTEAKVFAGYDDGLFRPEKKITRNEWIATLKRFQELNDVEGNHMKLDDKHWAMREIEAAFNEGWLKIYTDGLAKFKGDEFIPREEVAAVSNRAFNRVLDKDYIENNKNNLITYKDVDKSRWSYYDILCASNTFIYNDGFYRAHWIKQDNDKFNVNTMEWDILKAVFQRNPR